MPQKNTIKVYIEGGFYHIYNRGVNKRKIFKNQQDYSVFLSYLKEALSAPPESEEIKHIAVNVKGVSFVKLARQSKNFLGKIELLAYCLIPNHFHLLIKQNSKNDLESFTRSLLTRYSMYFNKKYNRLGPLYQGTYKASLVAEEEYLLHLSRYIHLNPSNHYKNLLNSYSSYPVYLGLKNTPWIKPNLILSFFSRTTKPEFTKINSYKDFIEKYQKDSKKILGNLTLE